MDFPRESVEAYRSFIIPIMEVYGMSDIEMSDPLEQFTSLSRRIATILNINVTWIHIDWQQKAIQDAEVPKLIRFLRACEGSTIKLRGNATKPLGKLVKGSELALTISDPDFLLFLEKSANTWLKKRYGDNFEDIFGWDAKKAVTSQKDTGEEYNQIEDSFFTEEFSNEEIEKIINYFKKQSKEKSSENGIRGFVADNICKLILPATKGWTQTKQYSFVYDVMLVGKCTGKIAITEEGFSGDIGREKAQQVRNWIKAFERYRGK